MHLVDRMSGFTRYLVKSLPGLSYNFGNKDKDDTFIYIFIVIFQNVILFGGFSITIIK